MKILIIQHEDSTTPGSTLKYLKARNLDYEVHFFKNGLPADTTYSGIIILGGGMNADEIELYPWLIEEKKYLKNCIENKIKIFGICLGAQLLSELLGGNVFTANEWELGWHPVQLANSNNSLMALHWHGQQFTLPPRAKLLGSSPVCPVQGFEIDQIKAYQFHPEADAGWVIPNAKNANFPTKTEFVQTREEVVAGLVYQIELEKWYHKELDQFFNFA